ncbi:MAG: WD40 repeat domain-containing protein [Pseudonocardiaceae bacterium]
MPECPYIGLTPFEEKHAAYFFGRERESDLIVANLTASRLTLLYAASGVGKSSVLRAGVLPQLHDIDDDPDDERDLSGPAVAYVSTWRDAPLKSIAVEVSAAVSRVTGAGAAQEAAGAPKLSVAWLREVLRHSRVSAIYLILDQFEEYFLYHPLDVGEKGLTAELGRILSARDLRVHVLLSMREDALARLDRFKGRVPHLFDNYLRLAHLSRDAAEAAIRRPLDRYNRVAPDRKISIESGLVEALLEQLRTGRVRVAAEGMAPDGFASNGPASDGRGDIETPFLQLVLTRLWNQERDTGSSLLRLSTLDDLGGAEKIVQDHVDNVMASLSPTQRDVAAAVFRHLITRSGAKFALAAKDLAFLSEQRLSDVQDLVETLSAGRQLILRPVQPAVGIEAPRRYEIFHDVMASAVLEWCRQHVEQRQKAEARRLLKIRLGIGLGIVLLIFIVFASSVYVSDRNAQRQEYLAQAASALGHNPAQSLEYAVDAYHVNLPWRRQPAGSAVLTAASSPRSELIIGPNPKMIGMTSTPDSRHMVAYDADGNIRIIDENGDVLREAKASGLRGAVIPGAVAVNPDASRVALGTDQGTVAVINTASGVTGQHIKSERGSPRSVTWIGSAANGLVLVVSGSAEKKDGVATTYHPETGERVAGFQDVIHALPLADDRHIVISGEDKKLQVWDARTGTKIAESPALGAFELRRYAQSVVSLSVVGLSVGAKPSIVVWDWQARRDPVRYPVDDLNGVRRIVVNDRAQTVIIAQDKKVRTYHLVNGSLLGELPSQAGSVTDVAISPEGQWITTASTDGRVLVWSSERPAAPTYELLARRGGVTQVSYLRDGKRVMGLGIDGTVQRWELPRVSNFQQPDRRTVDDQRFVHMDLSHDPSWLAAASLDGHVFIIDPRDLSKPPVATVYIGNPLRMVLFDPAQPHRILTLGRSDRVPKLWSWGGDGEPERLRPEYGEPPLPTYGHLVSIAISPDGQTVAGGDNRGEIHLWDAVTGELRTDRKFPGTGQPAYGLAFDPTGKLLAATDSDGVRLWRLGSAEPKLLRHPGANGVTFEPVSGQYLVSIAGDGTGMIWALDGKHENLVAHDHLSSGPSFSRDGRLLAVGTAGGLVEVWDVRSRATVTLDRHHSASVNNVVFLPGDGASLISASDDTTVAQFDCRACTEPGRDQVIRDAEEWVKTHRKGS